MRLTVRHVYDFGADRSLVGDDLVRPEAWDALRTETSGPFALMEDRAAWEKAALGDATLAARADAIDDWLTLVGSDSVASYGAGVGSLEFMLKQRAPSRALTLTDFGPETVSRLGRVFPEATVQTHDLLTDPPLDVDAHLMHRVDTELSNPDWHTVLDHFADQRILVVAASVISPKDAALNMLNRVRHRGLTKAGWARNAASLEALWADTHRARQMPVNDLIAWDLVPR